MTPENPYDIDNTTGVNQEGPQANTPVERLTAASIVGDSVETPAGARLGSIENLMINLNTGMVEYAVLELAAFLGIGGKLFAIPFSALKVAPEKKLFVLDCAKDFLERLPGFDKDHWPDTNDQYYEDANVYWRLSPGAFVS